MHTPCGRGTARLTSAALPFLLLLVPAGAKAGGAPAWVSVGVDGGRVAAFAQAPSAPSRMYAYPDQRGLYRSDDRGDTWAPVSAGLPMDGAYLLLAVSPVDENLVLLAGAANELLRSTDGGVGWESIPGAASWGVPQAMVFDPDDPDLVLTATRGGVPQGIYRSTDAGLTWAAATTTIGNANCVAFQPGATGVALAGGDGGMFRSTDGGDSWSSVATGAVTYIRTVSFCRDQPTRVWAGGSWGYNDRILTSGDGGLSFGEATAFPSCSYGNCGTAGIAAHPADPDQALLLWTDGGGPLPWYVPGAMVFRTTDEGASWTEAASCVGGAAARRIAYDVADADRAYVAVSGEIAMGGTEGLRRSLDGGVTWSGAMSGIRATRTRNLGHDVAGTIWVRAADVSHLYRADTPEGPWVDVGSANARGTTVFHVNPAAAGVLHEAGAYLDWDVYAPWHRWSTDGGATWGQTYIPETQIAEFPVVITSSYLSQGAYVWSDVPFMHLVADGHTLATFEPPVVPAGAVIDPGDPARQFAIGAHSPGAVHLTTDGGTTWAERATGLPADRAVDLLIDPANGAHLLAVYETAGAWETETAGGAWTPVPSPPPSSVVTWADWDPATHRVFAVTESDGVWITDLGFVTDGLPTRVLGPLDYLPAEDAVLLGTDHAGVYVLPLPPPAVDAPAVAVARTGLRVHPTPFTGSLTVQLDLPAAGAASSVVVFDVAGRRVATLLAEGTRAGSRTVTWDGRTTGGETVVPGAYFVSARIGEERHTERVVLIR